MPNFKKLKIKELYLYSFSDKSYRVLKNPAGFRNKKHIFAPNLKSKSKI